jgi:hypothetical protein
MRGGRIAAVVVAVALGASACGGGDDGGGGLEIGGPEDARARVAAAADVVDAVTSFAFTIDAESDAPFVPSYAGEGAFESDGDGRMAMSLDGVDVEMLFVDGAVYFDAALFGGFVDTPWATIDLAALSEQAGFDLGALLGGGGDPTATLDQLRGAGEVVEVGTEVVRGVETTRFHAVVDLHDSVAAAPEGQREALEQMLEQAQPVDVVAPADDEVTDLTELIGG